jgi:hypothetical protein
MQKAVPSSGKNSSQVEQQLRPPLRQPSSGAGPAHLAQLTAMANQSPRVQAQLKLAAEIQNSHRVHGLRDVATHINQGSSDVSQPKGLANDSAERNTDENVEPRLATTEHPPQTGALPIQTVIRMQNDMDRTRSSGDVVQARWVPGSEPFLKWEPAIQGYTWWFNQKSRDMAYTLASVTDLTMEQAQSLTWRPHREWQMDALEGVDPDQGASEPFTYEGLIGKGKKRWEELAKIMHDGGGSLHPETQSARDWFFNEYYRWSSDDRGSGLTSVATNYNARPDSYSTKRAKGEYTGDFNLEAGNMRLDQTYALGGPGEMYYNPRSGNAERMPASEVLFQQWRKVAREQQRAIPRLRVKEESVAGDGWKMVREIRKANNVLNKDATFEPGDQGFFAMLAVPNVTAAIFLIRDHGQELGIRTITKIDVQKTGHIRIYFG